MLKLDRHLKIEEELYRKVLLLAKEEGLSFSSEVSVLITEALYNRLKQSQLDKIEKELVSIKKIILLLLELVKQMYSDFNISPNSITDPKKSIALSEFFRKLRGSKLDE